MVNRMRQRNVDELAIGKDALHLAPEARVDAVVVAYVQEAAARQVLAQSNDFVIAQPDVAVTGDVQEWIVPQLVIHDPDSRLDLVDIERGSFVDCGEKIWQARWIRVPIAAAVVLQTSNRQASSEGRGTRDARRECHNSGSARDRQQRANDSPLAQRAPRVPHTVHAFSSSTMA